METKNIFETKNPLEKNHILGKITIMRHGDTEYTNQYPDLTPKGIERIREKGKYLKTKIDPEKENVFYETSPSARAKGTMSLILEELDQKDAEVRILKIMRSAEQRDPEKAKAMITEVDWRADIGAWDRFFATDNRFENSPDIWQPRSELERRFYQGLEYVIRSFLKYHKNQKEGKIPHLLAVSHFEFLNHFIVKVFNLDLKKDNLLGFAEAVEMEVRELTPDKPDKISIKVSFRGQHKDIIFNRENYSLIII